MDSGEMK